MKILDISKGFRLHEAPLCWSRDYYSEIVNMEAGWLPCDLPVDVRMPLLENGVIQEPLVSNNCRNSEWIADRSWWFFKEFALTEPDLAGDLIELVLEGLDTRSDIYINGHFLGTHQNVHYPFVYEVKEFLHIGQNTMIVRVTSGLEAISDCDMAELNHAVCLESNNGGKHRGDARRAFVRRPQYTVGWDWGPKVITIGITGKAFLRSYQNVAIREVQLETAALYPLENGQNARLKAMVNVENLSFIGTKSGDLLIRILKDGVVATEKILENELLTSGYNYLNTELLIESAQLWWPNGYGEQPLYQVEVSVTCEKITDHWPGFSYGIKTLQLDTSVIENDERNFRLVVNGVTMFCKGGNWVPNDFIYARVPQEKYHTLLDEAVEANFNMLRVWGGGLYERDLFYELCDEKGILLWHDFMFACSTYPDHQSWFREEMRREFEYQTMRLRNHCCLALFCGTNEVHWIFNSTDNPRWKIEFSYEHPYGLWTANVLAKEIIHKNCPQIPYWNSSPYGGRLPNSDEVGDVHRWHNAMMSLNMAERIEAKDYDTIRSKFVSEYGFVGPCCLETIKKYMGNAPLDRNREIWQMHCNVFEKGTVNAAIKKNYVDEPEKLSMEDYILYGGMTHALMYGYSLEAIRFADFCGGGLFWMYNDAWGEVGWTIIDYYLQRKIPYYAVKRALAHRKFTMRAADGNLILQGCNDTPEEITVVGRLGYVTFDGRTDETRAVSFTLAPHSREYLLQEKLPPRDFSIGTYMLYLENEDIDNIWLRMDDHRHMRYDKAVVAVKEQTAVGADCRLTLTSDSYAHGVYVAGGLKCSDNYFDLLPGEKKTILVKNGANCELVVDTIR